MARRIVEKPEPLREMTVDHGMGARAVTSTSAAG